MKVPFFDLRVNNKNFKKKFLKRAEKIFTTGKILLGPEVEELELKIAQFVKKKNHWEYLQVAVQFIWL